MTDQELRANIAKLKDAEARLRAGLPSKTEDNQRERAEKSKAMAYSLLGLEFAGIFAGATFGAYELDKYMHTSPWLTLVGISLGFGIALYRLIFVAQKLSE